jgi:hypothetical protein
MQFKKKRKPYEYEGDIVMQAQKNPYSPSSGKSTMPSGYGSASRSGPFQARSVGIYGDRFDTSDINKRFQRQIEDLIDAINNGRLDGKVGERQIFRLQEDQQSARIDYIRNAHQARQDEIRAQSPARAQRLPTSSFYDARTGRPLTPSQIDRVRQQERDQMIQMGKNPYSIHSAEGKFWENKNNTLNRLWNF